MTNGRGKEKSASKLTLKFDVSKSGEKFFVSGLKMKNSHIKFVSL